MTYLIRQAKFLEFSFGWLFQQKNSQRVTTLFRFAVGDKAASSLACLSASMMMPLSYVLLFSIRRYASVWTARLSIALLLLFVPEREPDLRSDLNKTKFLKLFIILRISFIEIFPIFFFFFKLSPNSKKKKLVIKLYFRYYYFPL